MCNPTKLAGPYAFQISGSTTISGTLKPTASLGRITFDGSGSLSGTASATSKLTMNGVLCYNNNIGGQGASTLAGQITDPYSLAYAQGQKGNGAGKNFAVADPMLTRPFEYSDPDFGTLFGSPVFRAGWVQPPDDGFFDQTAQFVALWAMSTGPRNGLRSWWKRISIREPDPHRRTILPWLQQASEGLLRALRSSPAATTRGR